IEIHEYQKSHMHSKVAVIDGQWATVGSSNIDPFSLLLAHEANVVVDDAEFAAVLRSDLELAMQHGSRQLVPASWKRKGLLSRGMAWLGYGLIRLIMGMVGIAEKNT
ncbi:MAG TPA: phospholipase D-like domain-containing protein, partial [Methylophilaceae bacterium]